MISKELTAFVIINRSAQCGPWGRFFSENFEEGLEVQKLPLVLGERLPRIPNAARLLLLGRGILKLHLVAHENALLMLMLPFNQIKNAETQTCLDTMGRKGW